MNNASLLFHGASWQWSGHVVRAIAQAHSARSSRPLYGILLRSHFVSRYKNFRCAYFSIHFRIKFLLFNDFPSYICNRHCNTPWTYVQPTMHPVYVIARRRPDTSPPHGNPVLRLQPMSLGKAQ
jgi:hypothetical protein